MKANRYEEARVNLDHKLKGFQPLKHFSSEQFSTLSRGRKALRV